MSLTRSPIPDDEPLNDSISAEPNFASVVVTISVSSPTVISALVTSFLKRSVSALMVSICFLNASSAEPDLPRI